MMRPTFRAWGLLHITIPRFLGKFPSTQPYTNSCHIQNDETLTNVKRQVVSRINQKKDQVQNLAVHGISSSCIIPTIFLTPRLYKKKKKIAPSKNPPHTSPTQNIHNFRIPSSSFFPKPLAHALNSKPRKPLQANQMATFQLRKPHKTHPFSKLVHRSADSLESLGKIFHFWPNEGYLKIQD